MNDLTKQIAALKLQILETEDPDQSEALLRQLTSLYRQMTNVSEPRPARVVGNLAALKAQCERLRDSLVGVESEEEKNKILEQMAIVQAEIAQVRGAQSAAVEVSAERDLVWWGALNTSARSDILNELLDRADKNTDGAGIGYYKAMLDFLRSGKEFSRKDVVRIRRAYGYR